MFTSLLDWLSVPVICDSGVDRPFRLRRASLLLMAGGWLVVGVSCLLGVWLVRHNVQAVGWFDLVRGIESAMTAVQWVKVLSEACGGAAFFAGMFSVAFFDRRDRIPVWRAE